VARIVPQHGEIVQPSQRANLRLFAVACALGAVFLVGLIARLQGISSSLWVDEFGTLWVVEKSLRDVAQRAIQVQGQTPVYYALVWGALRAFGESELALRSVSVVAVLAATAMIWKTARSLAGGVAGIAAATLFWFSPAVISVSVSARPYALGLFCGSISVLGFVNACQTGRRGGRLVFVVGCAALFWTHYLMSLMLGGLVAGYVFAPALRSKYPWRSFLADLFFIGVLLLPTLPQWLALTARRGSMNWSTAGPTLEVFKPFTPLFAVGAATTLVRRHDPDRVRAGLLLSLWCAVASQIGVLWLASLVGINLLVLRFLLVAIVPMTIIASIGLAGLGRTVSAIVVAGALLFAAPEVRATHQVIGSFSGAGFQQWREAVDDLAASLRVHPDAPVLYRSGFVEDDLPPLNELAPMSLAPLRSPGRVAPQLRIVPLPFRWSNPERERYFDTEIAPQLAHAPLFFFLGPPMTEQSVGSYSENLAAYVRSRWPNRFHISTVGTLRGLVLLRFSEGE
jgi:hypothetical protein